MSKKPKSKQPTCKSYNSVKRATCDPIFPLQLHSFNSIAQHLQPFLQLYQTDKPMLPFLADDMHIMLKALMKRFLKSEILKGADSLVKLVKLDVKAHENHLSHSKIDVGFAADKKLKELYASKKINDRQILQYRVEVKDFLVAVVSKILEKSPAKYSIVRNLRCLKPSVMADKPDEAKKMFRRILSSLNHVNQVTDQKCDAIANQFDEFIDTVVPGLLSQFNEFDKTKDRLGTLLYSHLSPKKEFASLWSVISKLLLLSHGQATVERGFSINRQVEVENLADESYIALRFIIDTVNALGGNVLDVPMTPELMSSVQGAHRRYKSSLEKKQKERVNEERVLKRKREEEAIDVLKKKKKMLEDDIKSLNTASDDLATKATKCVKSDEMRALLNKSVSFRNTVKEKQTELDKLAVEISDFSKKK